MLALHDPAGEDHARLRVRRLGDRAAAGITWAAEQGADVILLGAAYFSPEPVVDEALAAAEAAGALVVAPAYDWPSSTPHYPQAQPTVLSVGETDERDRQAMSSNYGPWVDVVAPHCNYGYQAPRFSSPEFCSTFSSAALVAGIAALAMSETPGLSPQGWRDAITTTSVPIGSWLAHGRVEALALLARDNAVPPVVELTAPASGATVTGTFTVAADAADDLGISWVEFLVDGEVVSDRLIRAPYEASLVAGELGPGRHELTARASDTRNVVMSAAVEVLVPNDEPTPPPPPTVPTYTYTEIGLLGAPVGRSEPADVNASGQVVGIATTKVPLSNAFLWDDGVMTDLGTLSTGSAVGSRAIAINDHGDIVGETSVDDPSQSTTFLYRDGVMTTIDPAFAPADINDAGLIVGAHNDPPAAPQRAVIWQDGELRASAPWAVRIRPTAAGPRTRWRPRSTTAGRSSATRSRRAAIRCAGSSGRTGSCATSARWAARPRPPRRST